MPGLTSDVPEGAQNPSAQTPQNDITSKAAPKNGTLNPQQRAKVIEMAKQGMTAKAIARQLGVNGQNVTGVISTARNSGKLPPFVPKGAQAAPADPAPAPFVTSTPMPTGLPTAVAITPSAQPPSAFSTAPVEQVQMQTPSQPAPPAANVAPAPAQIQQQPVPGTATPADDFTGGRSVVSASGGLSQTKYIVEREVPSDGLLGTHVGSFFTEELGQIYGSGIYVITKQEPGRPSQQFRQKVSESYGPPKFPKSMGGAGGRPMARPGWAPGAPFGQANHGPEEDHPGYRSVPSYFPGRADLSRGRHDEATTLEKAFETVEKVSQRASEEIERARKSGPDQFVTSFMRDQQELARRQYEEERNRLAEEKKAEQEKWERAQAADRERWERAEKADRERHQREIERIKAENEAKEKILRTEHEERERREARDREEREKRAEAERKFLIELQDKRMEMYREQSEMERKRLAEELASNREQMKDLTDRTAKTIDEAQRSTSEQIQENERRIQETLERERESLEREHKLKEKALDREAELQGKVLDAQRAQVENSSGDQIFNTVNTIVKELSKAMGQVVDLKKIEAMSPEAQAVHIAKGGGAAETPQATAQDPRAQAGTEAHQTPPAAAAEQEAPQSSAQAELQATVKGAVNQRVEDVIRENLNTPMLQDVLAEWALHVEDSASTGVVNATTFANFYIQLMQDEKSYDTRKGCAAFATFMKPRSWKKVYSILREAMNEDQKKIFDLPQAEEFYGQFKRLVLDQIMQYFEQFYKDGAPGAQGTAQKQAPTSGAPVERADAKQADTDEAGAAGQPGA